MVRRLAFPATPQGRGGPTLYPDHLPFGGEGGGGGGAERLTILAFPAPAPLNGMVWQGWGGGGRWRLACAEAVGAATGWWGGAGGGEHVLLF